MITLFTNYFQSESDELLDSPEGYNTDISNLTYRALQLPLQDPKSNDLITEEIITQCKKYISQYKEENEYQYSLNGNNNDSKSQNIWICKPAGKSRGRGIFLTNNYKEIDMATRGRESQWICQKYIEKPLIILNHKFDIRQWVLCTDWNPLTIYNYEHCYLRFCSEEYDSNNLNNIYMHLSNNCIQKEKVSEFDKTDFKGLMWSVDQFKEYLKENNKEEEDIYEKIIKPQINDIVIKSLQSCQGLIEERKMTYEMFGFDFMIDSNYHVWLIEINSSPDLSYSTYLTEKYVKEGIPTLMNIALYSPDQKKKINQYQRKIGDEFIDVPEKELTEEDYGYWKLVYKEKPIRMIYIIIYI